MDLHILYEASEEHICKQMMTSFQPIIIDGYTNLGDANLKATLHKQIFPFSPFLKIKKLFLFYFAKSFSDLLPYETFPKTE